MVFKVGEKVNGSLGIHVELYNETSMMQINQEKNGFKHFTLLTFVNKGNEGQSSAYGDFD
ncbi:hypothetical protein [Rhodohalobacter sp. 8-1]|uniref:hypothetical protein n=1 Tax=Rhodohalobacter sp. 8-1 TaxID=3131972 RepID=UPI0030ED4D4D